MKISPKDYYNKIAKKYDDSYKEPFWQFYHDLTWRYIQKYLPENIDNCKILDAGGGTGNFSILLAKLGYNVVLSDISEKMLYCAQEKIIQEKVKDKIELIKLDITNMSLFRDEIFDLVIAEGDPISYCSNPYSAISELSRVAKINSHVIISVDNKIKFAKMEITKRNFKGAEKILKTGITDMPTENGDFFPAYTFTLNDIKNIFKKYSLDIVFHIGKPVFATPELLKNKDNYERLMNIELNYSTNNSYVNYGGHIAVVGKKVSNKF